MYGILLNTHIALVVLSLLSFILRSSWAYFSPQLLANELALKAHKVVTLLLLLSALLLCISIGQYPFLEPWLTEKLLFLGLYVAGALFAFNPKVSRKIRSVFVVFASASFVLIFIIAKTHSPIFIS
ncbi:SirB2 family protein [Shewanella sp. SR44-3]|uniref:SirB2 family protein n=1 Tax=Shewanella sp. SR44-3 TaxID=2760936 RepID=UPI0015F89081|nr:SirB2 family protein [Shewanella sp. SR44-3]MBB1267848.1 SirB2 family protein [Shewanella sp. SR44-3]